MNGLNGREAPISRPSHFFFGVHACVLAMPEHRYVQQAGEMGMEKGKDGLLNPNCHDSCRAATKTRESHDRFKGGHGKRCCPRQDTHPHRHTKTQICPQDLIKPTGNVQRGVAASGSPPGSRRVCGCMWPHMAGAGGLARPSK